jgi:hypothetical protein
MMTRPNYIDTDTSEYVMIFAKRVRNTGSKQLHPFLAKKGNLNIGDEFRPKDGHIYIVERIETTQEKGPE